MSQSLTIKKKQRALNDIISRLKPIGKYGAKITMYATALGALAAIGGTEFAPEIKLLAEGIGLNLLSGIVERVANGESISDDKLQQEVEVAIKASNIENLLTEDTFTRALSKLLRNQNRILYTVHGNETELKQLSLQIGELKNLLELHFPASPTKDAAFLVLNEEKNLLSGDSLPVEPALDDEILVLIANFDGDGQSKWKIEERIVNALKEEISIVNIPSLRVERLRDLTIEDGDNEKAQYIAELLGATIIIWGWYDQVGFSPRFTVVTNQILESTQPEFDEVMIDATDQGFRHYMFRGLAYEMAFLATFIIGQLFYWDRHYQEALVVFNRAIEQAEANPKLLPGLALVYFYRGFILGTKQGDILGAATSFKRATELDSDFIHAFYNLGDALYNLEKYDDAIEAHSHVLALAPNHLYALIERGDAYFKKEDFAAAIDDYTKALDIHPWTRIFIARGRAFELLGKEEFALGDYISASTLDPYNNIIKSRLKPYSKRGEGKLHKVFRKHAPGPDVKFMYETALRILSRPVPSSITRMHINEDDEAYQLATLMSELYNTTGLFLEAGYTTEEIDREKATGDLFQILTQDEPSLDELALVIKRLHGGYRKTVRESEDLSENGEDEDEWVRVSPYSLKETRRTLENLLDFPSVRRKIGYLLRHLLELLQPVQLNWHLEIASYCGIMSSKMCWR